MDFMSYMHYRASEASPTLASRRGFFYVCIYIYIFIYISRVDREVRMRGGGVAERAHSAFALSLVPSPSFFRAQGGARRAFESLDSRLICTLLVSFYWGEP